MDTTATKTDESSDDNKHRSSDGSSSPGSGPAGQEPKEPGITPGRVINWFPGTTGIPGEVPTTACDIMSETDRNGIGCALPSSDPADPDTSTPAPPTVTITDLARFVPTQTVPVSVEPDGVAIKGRPANFIATASAHTVNGTLFGFPLQVRFTPDQYFFDYGDGNTRSTRDPGRAWGNDPQFTPTDTSHVYKERGTVTARVDILYTAEINFGGGWAPVAGHVTASGTPFELRVWEARTALIAHTCNETPNAPGC